MNGYRNPPPDDPNEQTVEYPQGYGTNEHATTATGGRHPGVRDALLWLTFSHLPPELRLFSRPFFTAALDLLAHIPTDSPELTTALNLLVQAKDSAVRAGIKSYQGRAGSIPRPQSVIDPPEESCS